MLAFAAHAALFLLFCFCFLFFVLLFLHEAIFFTSGSVPLYFFNLESLFEYNKNFLYRIKHERKFHYYEIFKVKQRGKMFSKYLLLVDCLIDFSPIK